MQEAIGTSDGSGHVIPARIVIGIVGHESSPEMQPALAEKTESIVEKIREIFPPQPNTPVTLTVLCSASQPLGIVGRKILETPGGCLEVIRSPMHDDHSRAGLRDADAIQYPSARIRRISNKDSAADSDLHNGEYIVNSCDVLVAVFDMEAPFGDENSCRIIEYACRKSCPMFVVNPSGEGDYWFEPGRWDEPYNDESQVKQSWLNAACWMDRKLFKKEPKLKPFEYLDQYNAESIFTEKTIDQEAQTYTETLTNKARDCGLPQQEVEKIEKICGVLGPHFVKADLMAIHYQRRYSRAGILLYSMAAAAVAVVAFQALFAAKWPQIVLLEVLLIIGILVTIWLNNQKRWHQKWIDYRYLAERLRSAIFMVAAMFEVGKSRPLRHLSLAYSPSDWMVTAFSSACSKLPYFQGLDPSALPYLKSFLIRAWLDDQIAFHVKASERNLLRYYRLELLGILFFALTFVAAVLHVIHLGPYWFDNLLAFCAIVFPAVGGSLGAIRAHREYLRNSKRYREMIRHLEELKALILNVRTADSIASILREVEQTMLHENEDWRVVVQFHELEPA